MMLYKKDPLLSKPYKSFEGKINLKVDLSNNETKIGLKNAIGIDSSNFTLKSNLVSLETELDKLDIDKLVQKIMSLKRMCMID